MNLPLSASKPKWKRLPAAILSHDPGELDAYRWAIDAFLGEHLQLGLRVERQER